MRVLSVAEKPSIAKSLAEVLGSGSARRRQSHDRYSAFWDLHSVPVVLDGRTQHVQMTITSVRGHLKGLDFEGNYARNWSACTPGQLLLPQKIGVQKFVPSEHADLQRNLEEEAVRSQVLLLWLDCDREGENIGFEVVEVCRAAKRNLRVLRARFSAVTHRDVQHALSHLVAPNRKQADAVDARQEADLRLGAAFTRFQTVCLQNRFHALVGSVVSFGPCQFPCVGFVAERQARIDSFVPEAYWSISMEHTVGERRVAFTWRRGRVYDRATAVLMLERCLRGGVAVVRDCRGGQRTKQRPVPLATIKMQQLASRLLHISPDKCMEEAEKLYQKGILSYPRTETEVFNRNMDLRELVQQQANAPRWGAYARGLLQGGGDGGNAFQWPREDSTKNDEAHPPIHPVRFAEPAELETQEQARLYELVTRHFLACCSRDAVGRDSSILAEVGGYPLRAAADGASYEDLTSDSDSDGAAEAPLPPRRVWWTPEDGEQARRGGLWRDGEFFEARGLQVVARNWLEVYPYERWGTAGGTLPAMGAGDSFRPRALRLEAGRTRAPERLLEEELLGLMERHGIGTDATMADHIKKVQERGYVSKDAATRRFRPEPLGVALLEGYKAMGIHGMGMPQLRRQMEQDCDAVAAGAMQKDQMVSRCCEEMRRIYDTAAAQSHKLVAAVARRLAPLGADPPDGGGGGGGGGRTRSAAFSACGACGGAMALVEHAGGKLLYLRCGACERGLPLPRRGEPEPREPRCPLCKYQVLHIGGGRGYSGNGYHLCPFCFSNPPPQRGRAGVPRAIEDIAAAAVAGPIGAGDEENEEEGAAAAVPPPAAPAAAAAGTGEEDVLGEFRCFQCSNGACALAGGLAGGAAGGGGEVGPCTDCGGGAMRLSRTQSRWKVGCSRYPECKAAVWFCDGVRGAALSSEPCRRCEAAGRTSRLLDLQLDRNMMMLAANFGAQGPRSWTLCVACDRDDLVQSCTATVTRTPRARAPAAAPAAVAAAAAAPAAPAAPGGVPSCSGCNAPFRKMTSRSEANPGREFFKCDACDVFKWCDEYEAAPANPYAAVASGVAPPPLCAHGTPAVVRTSRKQNENCGRKFYTCGAAQENRCNFFAWVDAAGDAGGRGRGAAAGGPRATASDVCYKCKQPGHFASACPNP